MQVQKHVDLLVIGWGKAGKTLAGEAATRGQRVAIIEQDDERIGGTCINVACVPTKILIHEANQGHGFDVALERRRTLTEAMRNKNYEMLAGRDEVLTISGRAKFVRPKTVEVTGGSETLQVSADTVIINTGTRPTVPPIPGAKVGGRIHNSETLQRVSPPPESLLIVGGGYVGLEFASMFAGFGTSVTVLDRGERPLKHEDDDVAEAAAEVLRSRGVRFVQGASVTQIDESAEAVVVTAGLPGREETFTADAVLLALGRTPVTEELGLHDAGVKTDEHGFIMVNEILRTSADRVFAVGDINGGPQFTYVSLDDYRIVADQLFGLGVRSTTDRSAIPYTMFLTPPLSRVGVTEREATERGLQVKTAVKRMADVVMAPRANIENEPDGIVKVIVDAVSDEVLGAALMHVHSQEVINLVAMAMRHGITATDLRDSIFTHPSSTEVLNEILSELR